MISTGVRLNLAETLALTGRGAPEDQAEALALARVWAGRTGRRWRVSLCRDVHCRGWRHWHIAPYVYGSDMNPGAATQPAELVYEIS